MSERITVLLDRPITIAGSRLASVALNLASVLLLARALGPAGRGQSSAALAILGIAPLILGLGLPLTVRRRAAGPAGAADAVRGVRIVAPVLVLPALALAWLCTQTVMRDLSTSATVVFCVAMAAAPLSVLWISDVNVLLAQGRHLEFALANLMPTLSSCVLVAVGWLAGHLTVAYAIAMSAAGTLVTLVYTTARLRVSLRGPHMPVGPALRESVRFAGSQVAEAASYRLDQVVALAIIGAFQAGLYSVAATVSLLPYALGQALGAVAFRKVAAAVPGDAQRSTAAAAIRGALVTAVVGVAMLAFLTPVIVPWVFGEEFRGSIGPTLLALVGSIGIVCAYVASSALTAIGKGWSITSAQCCGLIVGLGLAVPWGRTWGAQGLAIASSAGYWVTAGWCFAAVGAGMSELRVRRTDLGGAFGSLLGREP